ncbi:glutamate receptor 2.7-like [Neltuma alba]|uniref:glutamate receptor 2.7-like n=1 Tax=Neltuma alba TaxID=207710 RepID=UPI0010A585AB|nr:glutamate receptor 2.7-like [Prosopis alba]
MTGIPDEQRSQLVRKMKKKRDALVFYCSVILCLKLSVSQNNTTVPVKVGVLLDLSHTTAKIGLSSINMSLSDFYASHSHYSTRLLLHVRDSHTDVITASSQAIDLTKGEEVQAIIGPLTSMEANFVISLGDKAHVPILTFSATTPSLASLRSPYFFRLAQNDSSQVNAIAAIVQAFGWRKAVPIYVDNEYGKGVIPFLTNALQQAYVQIPYLSAISPSATDEDIRGELYKLMTMQTRVFVVHMSANPGIRLFSIAYEIGMMNEGYVWIVTDGLGNEINSLDSSVIDSMQGVLGVRTYVPKTKRHDDFKVRWRRKFVRDNPTLVDTDLNIFGKWAYDAATALAMAVEKAGTNNLGFDMSNASGKFSDLEKLGASQNGERLRGALLDTRFRGISGEFSVIDGQLQASTFEIINVNGNGERRVGFWTPEKGITRNLNFTSASTYSTSRNNLKPIIWPGDTYSLPKGWDNPTNEKKMRIGVPVKKGFTEFVKLSHNRITNTTDVDGFSIEVFKEVLKVLPYAVPYEFIPFAKPDGGPAGTYDELINRVSNGNLDAVVGDTAITADRSNDVDFTMPYTESGGTMIVLLVENKHKSPWAFLKPLTWDLWVTTTISFIFVAFVVWVLEHRINDTFRGPPSHQIGTSLWFSFSILVFAHREKIVSNCSRFVVTMWVFVVLILIQSYTASLTSLLTVKQLRPSVTDVNQLIKNKLNVGYYTGSFVRGMLKDMGFQESQLIPYHSAEHCDELFTLGTAKGGIDAAFDEMPNVKLFLATYCSKYTSTVPPSFRTDGFGYVFPKGSPLVADISRGIINVTQGDKMKTIENAWFKRSHCPEKDASVSSAHLSVDSFWGLFFIAGVAAISALLIFAVTFLYQHKHILHPNPSDSSSSIWKRISALLKVFDDKDLSSHTFRKSEHQSSPNTHCPPSPSSQTESNFSFSVEHGNVNPYGDEPQDDMEISMVHNSPPSPSPESSPSNN